jgi:hypothetical protein
VILGKQARKVAPNDGQINIRTEAANECLTGGLMVDSFVMFWAYLEIFGVIGF